MLTDQVLNTFQKYTRFSRVYRTVPYDWDMKTSSIVISNSKFQKLLYIVGQWNALFLLFYAIFVLKEEGGRDLPDYFTLLWLSIWIVFYTYLSVSNLNGVLRKQEVCAVFRGFKLFNSHFQDKFRPTPRKKVIWKFDLLDLHLLSVYWMIYMFGVAATLLFIMIPNKPQYFYHHLANLHDGTNNYLTAGIFIPCVCYEFYAKTGPVFMVATDLFHIFTTTLLSSFWVNHLCEQKTFVLTKIREFQKVELLMIHYNSSCLYQLWPSTITAFAMFTTIQMFGSIRLYKVLSFFEYVACPMCASFCAVMVLLMMNTPASLFAATSDFQTSLKAMNVKNKIIRREIRNVRPFGVRMGVYKCIDKLWILILLDSISNYIVNLLLAYPDKAFAVAAATGIA